MNDKYGNNSRLLFTDSLVYEIKTEDVYEYFIKDQEMLDFSNYSAKSSYYVDSNKLEVGKMKDETSGVGTVEFAGLKPKMYPLLVDDKCLRHLMNRIQSKYHQIGT